MENTHLQPQGLLSSNNTGEFDMNQINSAELRYLLDTGAETTGPFVEAHLSENLSSNLNIIDPNPALPVASSSNSNNLDQRMSTDLTPALGSFLPNILGSADVSAAGGAKERSLTVASFCDILNTPTQSSDSLTNLKSELELLNNS
jgi:hypothetical protein